MVEAAFAYSYGDHTYVSHSTNPLPQQFWGTGNTRDTTASTVMTQNVANPFSIANFASLKTSDPVLYQQMSTLGFFTSSTIQKNQLLRPYPQMSGLTNGADPVGKVWVPAFEVSLRRVVSRGVSMNVHYTMLDVQNADAFLNEFDAAPTKRPSAYTARNRVNVSALLELPFGKGRRYLQQGVLSQIAGGWQLGVTYVYQTGLTIDFGNMFYYGNLADIANGPHTIAQWFNTAGCVATTSAAGPGDVVVPAAQPCTSGFEKRSAAQPFSYQVRSFPTRVDGVAGPAMNEWNASLQKDLVIREGIRLNFRVDAHNLMNRTIFSNPSTTVTSTLFGQITSATEVPNRYIAVQARLRF